MNERTKTNKWAKLYALFNHGEKFNIPHETLFMTCSISNCVVFPPNKQDYTFSCNDTINHTIMISVNQQPQQVITEIPADWWQLGMKNA